ncbi:MAG: hypothetical protein ACD_58C00147G0006 [uncultured bacterium]|nr:MAG: hypothetical protein ACD_58C00147G0006 [uncultured bacterium]
MAKFKTLPTTASVREVQRNYKKLFDQVNKTKEPLFLLSNNKPKVVVLDFQVFQDMAKEKELTEDEALEIIAEGDKEYQEGKTTILASLKDLR